MLEWVRGKVARGTSIGLDLGSDQIKVAVIDHRARVPEVVGLALAPVGEGRIIDGEILDREGIGRVLAQLIEDTRARKGSLILGVGGHDVMIKRVELEGGGGEIDEGMIEELAAREIPFEVRDVELDFIPLDPVERGGKVPVLLVAAKRTLLQDRLELLVSAGLEPTIIDHESLALRNAVVKSEPGAREGLVGIIDLGAEMTGLLLLEGGLPIITLDLPVGASQIVDADSGPEELLSQLERVMTFLTTDRPDLELGRLLLAGGGARLEGLPRALARELQVRTEVVNPFAGLRIRPEVVAGIDLDLVAPLFTTSVGLALRRPRGRG